MRVRQISLLPFRIQNRNHLNPVREIAVSQIAVRRALGVRSCHRGHRSEHTEPPGRTSIHDVSGGGRWGHFGGTSWDHSAFARWRRVDPSLAGGTTQPRAQGVVRLAPASSAREKAKPTVTKRIITGSAARPQVLSLAGEGGRRFSLTQARTSRKIRTPSARAKNGAPLP